MLAAPHDVTRGSRIYLDAYVAELIRVGALPAGSSPGSATDLLSALERGSGTPAPAAALRAPRGVVRAATPRLVDIPPLELRALRQSFADIRRDAASLPGPDE